MDASSHNKAPTVPATAAEMGIMAGCPPPPDKRPTLSNWDHAPFNRWSFQHVRSLIPTVEVYRGSRPPAELSMAPVDLSSVAFTTTQGEMTTLADFLVDSYSDGFLVLYDGSIVYEAYFNGMSQASLHLLQSVSKSVAGALCGTLVDRGMLDPEAPLVTYVPELRNCGYADATVAHVLDMRSGVRFTEDYGARASDITRMDVASGWRPGAAVGSDSTIRDLILTLPKIRPHGGLFAYRSVETDVLAWAMERAAGDALANLVSELLWQPLGAERDAYYTVDSAGTALADGGFNATLRDMARFGEMMTQDGRAGGRQIVPLEWIARCRSGDPAVFGPPYTEVSPGGAYSTQWWVHRQSKGTIMARGVFGQLVYSDPSEGLTVVNLSSWPDYLMPQFTLDTLIAIDAIRDALR